MPKQLLLISILFLVWLSAVVFTAAQPSVADICPEAAIEPRGLSFEPGGMILTSFDRNDIWVYDIDRNARYPLAGTAPCGSYCNLSPDARWFTFLDTANGSISKMRLNGASKTPLAGNATEVAWWSENKLIIWTTDQRAYLQAENTTQQEFLPSASIINLQPGGYHAVILTQDEDQFNRVLVNLDEPDSSNHVFLGADIRYFSATSWSMDGKYLAYTAPISIGDAATLLSTELFIVHTDGEPLLQASLSALYGSIRINGHSPGELSWSPDGSKLAFWVIQYDGSDPTHAAQQATLHVLEVDSGEIQVYCGYSTDHHTPNPPRLIWSPDSSHIAFGADLPDDPRGYLLLALNTDTGIFTILSTGIYPATGAADVIAWGLPPS